MLTKPMWMFPAVRVFKIKSKIKLFDLCWPGVPSARTHWQNVVTHFQINIRLSLQFNILLLLSVNFFITIIQYQITVILVCIIFFTKIIVILLNIWTGGISSCEENIQAWSHWLIAWWDNVSLLLPIESSSWSSFPAINNLHQQEVVQPAGKQPFRKWIGLLDSAVSMPRVNVLAV